MRHGVWAGLLVVMLGAGCGNSDSGAVPVSGTVKVNDQPAEGAIITFIPDGDNKGHRGTGRVGADGKYEITGPQGQKGLLPGAYKVTISRPLRKDGTPLPPDAPPIEADARESLPDEYSSQDKTKQRATIEAGKPVDFDVKVPRK